MTEEVRIALLARAGMARDQLHKALIEAGAQIVAEGDPAELDPREVHEKVPNVYLVSLEPATEKSMDRFDAQLEAPGIEVMFDDAEVTGKLDGWDLNRWARHLASKLTGRELMPPAPDGAGGGIGAEPEHELTVVGLPPTPAELMDHAKLEDYTADSPELADWVPTSPSLTTAASDAEAPADEGFSWNGSETSAVGAGGEGEGEREFNLDTDLGIDIDLAHLDFAPTPEPPPPPSEVRLEDEPILQALEDVGEVRFSSFTDDGADAPAADLDADVAALAAQLEAFEKTDTRQTAKDPDFANATEEQRAKPAAAPAKKAGRPPPPPPREAGEVAFPELSLEPIVEEGEPEPPPIVAAFKQPEVTEFGVARKPMSLSLEGEGLGAVLILAGLGGPDAVRQLLSSLPDKLSVPVLLYQHLEVGKHERLVEQLAKISKLPVELAAEGDSPVPGRVSLLPAGMSATALEGDIRLRFAPGALADLIAALPPRESMIIVLSGADVQLVPLIGAMKDAGGLVLAQDPEVCFDAAAADSIRAKGAAVYPALGLAQQIRARWPL